MYVCSMVLKTRLNAYLTVQFLGWGRMTKTTGDGEENCTKTTNQRNQLAQGETPTRPKKRRGDGSCQRWTSLIAFLFYSDIIESREEEMVSAVKLFRKGDLVGEEKTNSSVRIELQSFFTFLPFSAVNICALRCIVRARLNERCCYNSLFEVPNDLSTSNGGWEFSFIALKDFRIIDDPYVGECRSAICFRSFSSRDIHWRCQFKSQWIGHARILIKCLCKSFAMRVLGSYRYTQQQDCRQVSRSTEETHITRGRRWLRVCGEICSPSPYHFHLHAGDSVELTESSRLN